VICGGKSPAEECKSIPGLKVAFEGEHFLHYRLHVMGAQKSWPHVGTRMIAKPTPYYPNYNASQCSFQNKNYPQSW